MIGEVSAGNCASVPVALTTNITSAAMSFLLMIC
jgi:hypothetical protein